MMALLAFSFGHLALFFYKKKRAVWAESRFLKGSASSNLVLRVPDLLSGVGHTSILPAGQDINIIVILIEANLCKTIS